MMTTMMTTMMVMVMMVKVMILMVLMMLCMGCWAGHPVIGVGAPCDLETMCVHPTHGKKGATAVGEAFWQLYFSKHLQPPPTAKAKLNGY